MVDERIARRRAQVRSERRWVRLRRTLLVSSVVVAVVAVVWFEGSEHATILAVEVVGTSRADRDDVTEASGLRLGDPAFRVRPAVVVREVERLALVRTATVRRSGGRTVLIEVNEREPVYAAVHRADAIMVDREGVVIARGRESGLPLVRLATPPPPPGELVAAHAALSNAHRAWTGLSGPLRSRVVGMDAPDEDGLEMLIDTGQIVRFGRAEQLEEKIRALGAILDDVAGSEVVLIDVRVPGFPVVRID